MIVAFEFVEGLLMIGAHNVGDVLGRVQITHFGGRVLCQYVVAHSMNQVRLSQTDPAINEQRVVGSAGMFGHLQSCGARKLVGFSNDETVESELWNQARFFVSAGSPARWLRD